MSVVVVRVSDLDACLIQIHEWLVGKSIYEAFGTTENTPK